MILLLGQWLNFKLFGITYLVGKIKFKLFFSGSIGWVSTVDGWEIRRAPVDMVVYPFIHHYLQGFICFIHLNWCRISSINRMALFGFEEKSMEWWIWWFFRLWDPRGPHVCHVQQIFTWYKLRGISENLFLTLSFNNWIILDSYRWTMEFLDHPEWWRPLWINRHSAIPKLRWPVLKQHDNGTTWHLSMDGNTAAINIIHFKSLFCLYHDASQLRYTKPLSTQDCVDVPSLHWCFVSSSYFWNILPVKQVFQSYRLSKEITTHPDIAHRYRNPPGQLWKESHYSLSPCKCSNKVSPLLQQHLSLDRSWTMTFGY